MSIPAAAGRVSNIVQLNTQFLARDRRDVHKVGATSAGLVARARDLRALYVC